MNPTFVMYTICQILFFAALIYDSIIQSVMFSYSIGMICLQILLFILSKKNPGYITYSLDQLADTSHNSQITGQNFNQQCEQKNKLSFCEICNVEKRLRSHHCQECKKCVATFENHCNFLGKCIGQKNRHLTFLFCFIQTLHGLFVLVVLIQNIIQTGRRPNRIIMLISISLISTFLMGTLTVFQMYFMVVNLTMNQYIKKQNNLSPEQKYPYSYGIFKNISQYWIAGFQQQYMDWKQSFS